MEPVHIHRLVIPSPLGPLTLCADASAVTALRFGDFGMCSPTSLLEQGAEELHEYFAGHRNAFTLPLRCGGTPFQRRVWESLLGIPYGRTISYRDLAERAGCPKGFRAVGAANGKNPLPILIPCHRVIAADGTLGGYTGGLDRKRFLLALETGRSPE